MLDDIIDFTVHYGAWLATLSVASLMISLILTLYVVAKLPKDYWTKHFEEKALINYYSPLFYIRNILALFLLSVGIILLFMPGQGTLTILVAIIVSESPFKNMAIQKMISFDSVRIGLNTMRRWMKKDDFIFQRENLKK